ncbi:MAG TPA: ribosome small subunit-dependent GTPase A [Ignavibacteriales bacterium]|nr:ribosome small subunit-dependent GTPase A [Ignavibacteriales bacterium]
MSRSESKDYYVFSEKEHSLIRCSLKGKFKKDFNLKKDKLFNRDFASVGDLVLYDLNDDGTGVIYEILPRKNFLSRKAIKTRGASFRGERLEQIIASNIDNIFIVTSTLEPDFNNKTLDRFLVACESAHIKTNIIINKTDLAEELSVKAWAELYKKIGYRVFLTSALDSTGVNDLFKYLKGKKNLFWGQSGVGKSTLLNLFYPDLNLKVGEISNYTLKGTHTTVTSVMIFVGDETYIIDTPGVREIDPFGIRKEDLGHYFIEFENYMRECKFNTCTHHHEPGCKVINAVEKGDISEERYDSYLRILETVEKDMNF